MKDTAANGVQNAMLPAAFLRRMRDLPGFDYEAYCCAVREPDVRAFRVNTGKTTDEALLSLLPFKTRPVPFLSHAYYAPDERVGGLPAHHAGMFYMQDPSAMCAVAAAGDLAGARVLDLCAAPGGKTTQLAAAVGTQGIVISNEYVTARCRILQSNVERMGLCNTVVTNLSPDALADLYDSFFDLTVVDAPCSGEGMFRKYDNAAAEWSEAGVAAAAARQREILRAAAKTVKPGGRLLYSTCTFSIEENEANVVDFLTHHPSFSLISVLPAVEKITAPGILAGGYNLSQCRRFYPYLSPGEGQFVALFRRDEVASPGKPYDGATFTEKHTAAIVEDFLRDHLTTRPAGRLVTVRENVCLSPDVPLPPHGVFAAGVTLGTLQKGRFLPHHHLFSAFGTSFVRRVALSADDVRVPKYLTGEEIICDVPDGYAAVLYAGAPLGGGKAAHGILKNYYPKGLRTRG